MSPHFEHMAENRPDAPAKTMKRSRPNALRNVQVLPPHNVDLTLQPGTQEQLHVPAHVSGSDLSKKDSQT